MRNIITADIPEAARMLKRIGVKETLLEVVQKITAEEKGGGTVDQTEGGVEVLWALFDMATENNAVTEFYTFLARLFEVTPQEMENMKLVPLMDGLEQLYAENDLSRFFGFVRKLMK